MPRDPSGTYALPAGNPVATETTIESNWANTTLDDVATGITNSVSRNGEGGMTAQLKLIDGTAGAPAWAFNSDSATGMYRTAGALNASVSGVLRGGFTTAGSFTVGQLDNDTDHRVYNGEGGVSLLTSGGAAGYLSQVSDSGNIIRPWVTFNEDEGVDLYFNTSRILRTQADGVLIGSTVAADGGGVTTQSILGQARMVTSVMSVELYAENNSGDGSIAFKGFRNGASQMFHSGDLKLYTRSDGFECRGIARILGDVGGGAESLYLLTDDLAPSYTNSVIFGENASAGSRGYIQVEDGSIPRFAAPSDIRLKSDIQDADGAVALARIEALRVREYEMFNSFAKKTSLGRKKGFIAQEVEQVFPEAVTLTSPTIPDSRKLVSEQAFYVDLIQAVQVLSARVKELEAKSP